MVSFASLQLPDGQVGSPYLHAFSILSTEAQSMPSEFYLVGLKANFIQKFDAKLINTCSFMHTLVLIFMALQ
jgi:hypothetical protein